jgi:non-lysosomal glucosylceramidase
MVRKCKCSGGCCGSQADGVNRRDFLALIGAGAATTAVGAQAWGKWLADHTSPEELAQWKKALMQAVPPTVYRSGVHTDARMHLGGIGTGNIEIGVDGQFTQWQLFNTLADGMVPLMFAAKAGDKACLLQTAGGPDWPRVKAIELQGEYPIATLRYDTDLPVKIELSTFSPFAPLDSKFSSMPLAALVFRVQNPTAEKQTVSLAALMQNPVGYDAVGAPISGNTHEKLGGNVNEPLREGKAAGLAMRAEPGKEPALDKPVHVLATENIGPLAQTDAERPKSLTLAVMENNRVPAIAKDDAAKSVIWIEEPAADFPEASLAAAKRAVEAGATLVFAGKVMPLVAMFAAHIDKESKARPHEVFDDFEKGYDRWKAEGDAFGREPVPGTLPNQQPVTGFTGRSLVNSYIGGDNTTGKLVSQPFTIERNYIRFLVGGGARPTTQIRLIVEDKVVRASSGRDDERLLPQFWDVREFAGKKARIEIIDEEKGPWGHINVDQIEFADHVMPPSTLKLLKELLPPESRPDSERTALAGGLKALKRQVGKGQVVVLSGAILEPALMGSATARHKAYRTLCELAGAKYSMPEGIPPSAPGFGTLALVALADSVTVLPAFEDWNVAWEQFKTDGAFVSVDSAKANPPTPAGQTINGAVAATFEVPAGGSVEVPFLLAWHYPNKYSARPEMNYGVPSRWMGNYYCTLWPDAKAVVRDAAANFPTLKSRTESFRKTFYDSTLPYWLLDCITSQAATIRHIGVVFQIANGEPYGWEGSNGCCQPTCTHVWGYEQTLSRLFPDLERGMRRIDFKCQQDPGGGVHNRTICPTPGHPTSEHPFADGHASCILKAYREALNSPDDGFLKEYWPHVKWAVEYLIGRDAAKAGGTPEGILQDDQWNTYDQAIHGVTTFISAYYLAALRAGEEWAKRMGDTKTAERFHGIFLKGQENLIKRCWNGEYFQQDLPNYMNMPAEVGPGCMADQLIGQWWAHQLGLGYLLPKEKVLSSLSSIFKYSWLPDLTGFKHSPRAFAGDKDRGLVIVTWPKGGRPGHVMLYSDEVWTGIEYQVAGHMVYEGMIEEAFAIVKGARDRYNGIPRPPIGRNPWNEIECGGHYARAMSSWSLLTGASGFEYDGPAKKLKFTPRVTPEKFKSFFVGPEGWGSLSQTRTSGKQQDEICVVEGQLLLREIRLATPAGVKEAAVVHSDKNKVDTTFDDAKFESSADGVLVTLARALILGAGETLSIVLTLAGNP